MLQMLHLNWFKISVINLSGVQTWVWKVSAKHTFDVASVSIKTSGILKMSLTSFAFIKASNDELRLFINPWKYFCTVASSHICILNPQSSASYLSWSVFDLSLEISTTQILSSFLERKKNIKMWRKNLCPLCSLCQAKLQWKVNLKVKNWINSAQS